jgi:hypothetical protein
MRSITQVLDGLLDMLELTLNRWRERKRLRANSSLTSERINEVRRSILAQAVLNDYLEEVAEKAKLMESQYGSDYPREISKAFQDLSARAKGIGQCYENE